MRKYFVAIAVILVLCPVLRGAQSIEQQLQAKVQNYSLSEPTFADALAAVASQFKIAVGIELVATPSVLRPVKRSLRNTTVMEILKSLVRDEKGYGLSVDGGIVHVFQKELVDRSSNFLNIRIRSFEARNTSAPQAGLKLWRLVNPRFQPPKPPKAEPHGTMSTGVGGGMPERAFALDLHDATVRHILDSVAISSEHKIWVVTFAPGRSLTPTGFRRIASLTSRRIPPDAYQPGWDLLRWGEKPY